MLNRFAAGALALACLVVPARAECLVTASPSTFEAFGELVEHAGAFVVGRRHGSQDFLASLRPAMPDLSDKPAANAMILDRREGRYLVVFHPPGTACVHYVRPGSAADAIISTWVRDRS